jgi:NADP-dependent 3-hydroxy acid dehydrogenase YdfG
VSSTDRICAIVGYGPGISLAVANRFVREGYALQLFARNQQKLDEHVKRFREAGATALGRSADAGKFDQLQAAMGDAAKESGYPSVLVYNAVTDVADRASTISPKALSAAFDVGATGMIAASQFVLKDMQAKGRGTILITGGQLGETPWAVRASMSACKAALRSLALTLAEDVADMGVHVVYFSNGVPAVPGSDEARIIGDAYWNLHSQPRHEWQTDVGWHSMGTPGSSGWWPFADGGAWARQRAAERAREG